MVAGKTLMAKNATGSVPFMQPGVTFDGKTVFTSDEALKLKCVSAGWVSIAGRYRTRSISYQVSHKASNRALYGRACSAM